MQAYISRFKLFSTLLLLLLTIAGCGGSDNEGDGTQDPYQDYAQDEYDPILQGWRAGRLTVELEFILGGNAEEVKENGGFAKANWNETLTARLEHKVMVTRDLRQFLDIDASMSEQERMDAFGNSIFSELDAASPPTITGSLSYHSDFNSYTPNSSGPDWLREHSSGTGHVDYVDLKNFSISRFGKGYEFDLHVSGEAQSRSALLSGGSRQDIGEDVSQRATETIQFEDKFKFSPKPDQAIFELVPFKLEMEGVPQSIVDGNIKMQRQLFSLQERLFELKDEPYLYDFSPSVTDASEDKLVVKYVHNGRGIAPRFAGMTALMAKSQQNLLTVTVTIEAD